MQAHVNVELVACDGACLALAALDPDMDGEKELIALTDGDRKSAESWADLRRDCARRGKRASVVAAGALGCWTLVHEG
jgi:putative transposase